MEPRTPKRIGYDDEDKGLTCKHCGCHDFRTMKTERQKNRVYRYRKCRHCGTPLSTTEQELS